MTSGPEFSRPVAISSLADDGTTFCIHAGEAERAALAQRFALRAITALTCEGIATASADGKRIRVTGRLTAEVVQTCGVTLEPLPVSLDVTLVRVFAADAVDEWSLDEVEDGEIIVTPDDEDAPEPLSGDSIDLGEMAAEILALELDPFPRRADAAFDGYGEEAGRPDGSESPFAALRSLQTGSGTRSDSGR